MNDNNAFQVDLHVVVQAIYHSPVALYHYCHNEHDGISNHQPHHCLLNSLFGRRSKKTSKLRVTGLCAGNSSVTDEFPAQTASNAEIVSIWWRHYAKTIFSTIRWGSLLSVQNLTYVAFLLSHVSHTTEYRIVINRVLTNSYMCTHWVESV